MNKDEYKTLKILYNNKEYIFNKNDYEIYNSIPKINKKYSYDEFSYVIGKLNNKEIINGYYADDLLNDISINTIERNKAIEDKKNEFWGNKITPILNGIIFPIIVSIIVNIIANSQLLKSLFR